MCSVSELIRIGFRETARELTTLGPSSTFLSIASLPLILLQLLLLLAAFLVVGSDATVGYTTGMLALSRPRANHLSS